MIDWIAIRQESLIIAVRSRGPGGQNVNKVSSACQIFWNIDDSNALSIEQKSIIHDKLTNFINNEGQFHLRSDEFRDFGRNRERCFEKLENLVRQALHRPKPRKKTKPTKASRVRRQKSKRLRSETKVSRRKPSFE